MEDLATASAAASLGPRSSGAGPLPTIGGGNRQIDEQIRQVLGLPAVIFGQRHIPRFRDASKQLRGTMIRDFGRRAKIGWSSKKRCKSAAMSWAVA